MSGMRVTTRETFREVRSLLNANSGMLERGLSEMEAHNSFLFETMAFIAIDSDENEQSTDVMDAGAFVYATLDKDMVIPKVSYEIAGPFEHNIDDRLEWTKKELVKLQYSDVLMFSLIMEFTERIHDHDTRSQALYCATVIYRLIEYQLESDKFVEFMT